MSRRLIAGAGLLATILYTCWIGWPYLEAVVVRDAAVTTWIGIAPSPISGYTTNPLYPGARVGADSRIATISDDRADGRDLARTRAELLRAEAALQAQALVVDGMRIAVDARVTHADGFASTFGQDLGAAVEGDKASLVSLQSRLTLAKAEVDRLTALTRAGVEPQASLDTARAAVAALDQEIAATNAALLRASKRERAAASGVFLLEDGTDGNSTFQNLADAKLRLKEAEASLTQLRAQRDAARTVLTAAEAAYDKSRALDIIVPKGAMVWSLISSPGAPVQPGSPVATWVDCGVMLVDVPVPDVEAALVKVGAPADVVLEGERHTRRGTVLLTRGSAGTLDAHDLAAIAKGRRPGIAQVLVTLQPTADDVRACSIGRAAYVDFPDVGVLQVIRGRLRF
jgi:multidrug resistance efflux pump